MGWPLALLGTIWDITCRVGFWLNKITLNACIKVYYVFSFLPNSLFTGVSLADLKKDNYLTILYVNTSVPIFLSKVSH